MHLIDALASGVRGCENGSVRLFRRGTATRASWYNTFEASTAADSSGADIQLDSNGGVVAYVNEFVEVDCYSSTGVLVRSFVAGAGAPGVEVISPAFTGVDYVTGVSAVSKPLPLSTVLDRWLESSGTDAIDWKVRINGTATTLAVALGAISGLVFNVKNPSYGATGDGVTDDTAAIQAALSAAIAAGGGIVFFPLGTYRTTSAITWSRLVSMWGVGGELSVITIDHASANVLNFTTGTPPASPISIRGMTFTASQSNVGTMISDSIGVNLLIDSCTFCATSNATGVGIAFGATAGKARITNSVFKIQGPTLGAFTTASAWTLWFENCEFIGVAATFNGDYARPRGRCSFFGCVFSPLGATAGTFNAIAPQAASDWLNVQGSRFLVTTQAFTACVALILSITATTDGNFYAAPRYSLAGVVSGADVVQGALELSEDRVVVTGTTVTISDGVGTWVARCTSTEPTVTMPKMLFEGQRLQCIVFNGSGVAWSGGGVVFSGATTYGSVTTTVSNGGIVYAEFAVISTDAGYTNWEWAAVHMKANSA